MSGVHGKAALLSAGRYRVVEEAVRTIVFALAVAFALEIAVFNFGTLQSLTYGLAGETEQMAQVEGETFGLPSGPGAEETTDEKGKAVGEVRLDLGEDATVNNIEFRFAAVSNVTASAADAAEAESAMPTIHVGAIDEGNADPYELGSFKPEGDAEYFKVNAYGHVKALIFQASASDAPVEFAVAFNAFKPLDISWLRFCCLVAVCAFAWLVRPRSLLHVNRFSHSWAFPVGVAVVFALIVIALMPGYLDPNLLSERPWYNEYSQFARAFAAGQLHLLEAPDPALVAMENPYDVAARNGAGFHYLWDHAYFDGRYYMYFGVLPLLVFHLPFHLLTGGDLNDAVPVLICTAVCAAGLVRLVYVICRRWFPHATQADFLIASVVMFAGSWIVFFCRYADMYVVPISMGLALTIWGLSLWIDATANAARVDVARAAGGSVCIALVLACRPQLMIAGLIGVALIWFCARVKTRNLRKAVAFSVIPFVVVAVGIGLYNAARFGSPFDFGANYNLTNNDMTHRGFNVDRLPLGIFADLFQPLNLAVTEPFMRKVELISDYHGRTVSSNMHGGLFALVPVLLVSACLLFSAFRKRMPRQTAAIALVALASGFVLVVFDVSGAGIINRYLTDFGLFFALAAAMCILVGMQARSSGTSAVRKASGDAGAAAQHASGHASSDGVQTLTHYSSLFQAAVVAVTLVSLANTCLWLLR